MRLNFKRHVLVAVGAFALSSLLISCDKGSNSESSGQPAALEADDIELQAGISNYHQLYTDVSQVNLTIKDLHLMLDDAKEVQPKFTQAQYNFKDILGFGKGIKFSLKGVTLPEGAADADVVEIHATLKTSLGRLLFADGSVCELKVPEKISLYTLQPINVLAENDYLIKVKFDALHAIQFDCKDKHGMKSPWKTAKNILSGMLRAPANDNMTVMGGSSKPKEECGSEGKPCQLQCTLACSRFEIANIVNVIDEF